MSLNMSQSMNTELKIDMDMNIGACDIVMRNLHKRYQGSHVVRAVSLHLPRGKVISLIGPNGAGKSTVLNMLARLTPIDDGSIHFLGQDVTAYPRAEFARKLAILTQQNNIQSKLTVRELVSFGRFPYSQGRLTATDLELVAQALSFMELDELAERFLDELSGGQRQRALIAMVLAQDTDYILLDEPTNNLDIYHATRLMQTVRRLCDELGKSVIMVLHELHYAALYSDYICAFKNGQVAGFGSVEQIMEPKFLKDVYDVDFTLTYVNGKPLPLYF